MAKKRSFRDVETDFQGLFPLPHTMDGDWSVDSPSVTWGKEPRSLLRWMADAHRQQPLMADSLDVDTTPWPEPTLSDNYPHPGLSLPPPVLTLDFRMSVTLDPAISVGKTPLGERKWISFTGGTWTATFGSGTVVPGSQDYQIIAADLSTRVETKYLLQTSDMPPAFIVAKTHGWRTEPPAVLDASSDPQKAGTIDQSSYNFRLFIDLETSDERYQKRVNCGMWIGSGTRKGAEIVYDAYRVS